MFEANLCILIIASLCVFGYFHRSRPVLLGELVMILSAAALWFVGAAKGRPAFMVPVCIVFWYLALTKFAPAAIEYYLHVPIWLGSDLPGMERTLRFGVFLVMFILHMFTFAVVVFGTVKVWQAIRVVRADR